MAVQAYEVLEIFLELLTVRLQMIEKSVDIPNDMFECLASLVYAASRVQVSPPNICQIVRDRLCGHGKNRPPFAFRRWYLTQLAGLHCHSDIIMQDMEGLPSEGSEAAFALQDFPELVSIRGMLGHKYGKEFIEKASSDASCRQFMVNENLIRYLCGLSGLNNNFQIFSRKTCSILTLSTSSSDDVAVWVKRQVSAC